MHGYVLLETTRANDLATCRSYQLIVVSMYIVGVGFPSIYTGELVASTFDCLA